MDLLYIIIFLPLIIGFIIGFLYKPDNWYKELIKPKLIPPPYIFSIVWAILYLSIGFAYYIALKNKSYEYWIIPILHLLVNFIYTPLLFGFHQLYASVIALSLTLILALIIIIQFYYYDKTKIAYKLLIPYIIWLLFANYLGWNIYIINR